MQTRERAQSVLLFRLVSFVHNLRRGEGAVARGELCAWDGCRGLYSWLGASVLVAVVLLLFLSADLVQVSVTVPEAHTWVVSLALSPAPV